MPMHSVNDVLSLCRWLPCVPTQLYWEVMTFLKTPSYERGEFYRAVVVKVSVRYCLSCKQCVSMWRVYGYQLQLLPAWCIT